MITFPAGSEREQTATSIRDRRSLDIQLEHFLEVEAAVRRVNKRTPRASNTSGGQNRANKKLQETTEGTSGAL
jgi:hypothetical protein